MKTLPTVSWSANPATWRHPRGMAEPCEPGGDPSKHRQVRKIQAWLDPGLRRDDGLGTAQDRQRAP